MGFGVVYIEKNYCLVDIHFPPPPFNVRYSALALLTSTKNRFPGQLPSQAPPPTEPTYAPARLPKYANLLFLCPTPMLIIIRLVNNVATHLHIY